jgi:solute:Na+ symporter, SSS family
LTRRANEKGTMIGMACGLALELYLWRLTKTPFTWYVAIGTVTTFVIGYTASILFAKKKEQDAARA